MKITTYTTVYFPLFPAIVLKVSQGVTGLHIEWMGAGMGIEFHDNNEKLI